MPDMSMFCAFVAASLPAAADASPALSLESDDFVVDVFGVDVFVAAAVSVAAESVVVGNDTADAPFFASLLAVLDVPFDGDVVSPVAFVPVAGAVVAALTLPTDMYPSTSFEPPVPEQQ